MTTLVRLAKRASGSGIDDFRREIGRASDWSAAARYGLRGATQALTMPGALEARLEVLRRELLHASRSLTGRRSWPAGSMGWARWLRWR